MDGITSEVDLFSMYCSRLLYIIYVKIYKADQLTSLYNLYTCALK